MRNVEIKLEMINQRSGVCTINEWGYDYHEKIAVLDVWYENGLVELEGDKDSMCIAEEIDLTGKLLAKLEMDARIKNQSRITAEFDRYFNRQLERILL